MTLRLTKRRVAWLVALPCWAWAPSIHAETYYVDATGGGDANAGTSPQSAWQTIAPVEARMQGGHSGDTFYFKRGEQWDVSPNGLEIIAAGTIVGAYGSGPPPILDAAAAGYGVMITGDDVVVEDLQVQNAGLNAWCVSASSCARPTVRNCTLILGGTGDAGGLLRAAASTSGADYYGNTLGRSSGDDGADQPFSGHVAISAGGNGGSIHGNFIYHTTTETDQGASSFASYGIKLESLRGAWQVHDNSVYHVGTHGIYLTQEGGPQFTLDIHDNVIEHPGNAGISLYRVHDNSAPTVTNIFHNTVSHCDRLAPQNGNSACGIHLNNHDRPSFDPVNVYENVVHDCVSPKELQNQDSGGIALDYDADGARVFRNLLYDNAGKGIYIYNANRCQVWGNILWGNDAGITVTAEVGNTAADNVVFGNTFYRNYNDDPYGPGYDSEILFGMAAERTLIKNNIAFADDAGYALTWIESTESLSTELDHNLLFSAAGSLVSGSGGDYDTWVTEHAADFYAAGRADLRDDPGLVDPELHDFRLRVASAAVDTGLDLGADYGEAVDPSVRVDDWPDAVTTAAQGSFGNGWDIGAYVYHELGGAGGGGAAGAGGGGAGGAAAGQGAVGAGEDGCGCRAVPPASSQRPRLIALLLGIAWAVRRHQRTR